MTYHVPIMRQEIVDGLRIKPNGVYLDCTLGGGGHAEAILTAAHCRMTSPTAVFMTRYMILCAKEITRKR